MNRDEARQLLMDQHHFPGPFDFVVIVRPEGRAPVVAALGVSAPAELKILQVEERLCRAGSYVSLRIQAEVLHAEAVLDAWAFLKDLPEVVMLM